MSKCDGGDSLWVILTNILTMYRCIISHDMEAFSESHFLFLSKILTFDFGAAVAQWVKCWPADLAVQSLIPIC